MANEKKKNGMDVRKTTFPSAEEMESIMKIDSAQRRIEIMVRTKNEIKMSIRPLIKNIDDESVWEEYDKLFDRMDRVIAKDAELLAEISDKKQPKITAEMVLSGDVLDK